MKYDFVEIGTSDFDTLIQSATDEYGISIEPIKYYLDNLPNKKNVKKVNAALSNKDGEIDIYYIPSEVVDNYALPWWVKGSNSVNHPHVYTISQIGKDIYDKLVKIEKVPTISWRTLIETYDVTGIEYLKIDTEGHDHIILQEYLKECKLYPNLFANKIKFEYLSGVSNIPELDKLIPLFKEYIIERGEMDIILTRKEIPQEEINKYEKAYVLYATKSYIPALKECVNSIKTFSNIPIIVYLLNCEEKIDEILTINYIGNFPVRESPDKLGYIDRANPDVYNILIQKPVIVKDALEKYAEIVAFIDCDSIATKYIDSIFDMYPKDETIPYFTQGIYDYLAVDGKGNLENPACELFNIDQSVRQHYRQTGFFVAGQNTIPFLEEWRAMCNYPKVLENNALYAPFDEETLLNILMYKWNRHEGLPYIYTNASLDEMENIYNNMYPLDTEIRQWFKLPKTKEQLLFLHGEKDPIIMRKMTKYLSGEPKKLKVLYLESHISTGGAPQFCLKRLEVLQKDVELFVVEYSFASPDYIVQRNKIIELVKENFYSLGEDKYELINIIKNNHIDVVHLDETIEFFRDYNQMPIDLINQLYDSKRTWKLVETCHNIVFDSSTKKYNPNCYSFCTPYHLDTFKDLPSLKTVIEYPIDEQKNITDLKKISIRKKLGFNNVTKTHILNVGLWNENKNQGEGIEIAKKYPDMEFHFVGNMASNFSEYWEPLIRDIQMYGSLNIHVWGERNDVDLFYKACDVFMFNSTYECNPVVLKESISYGLPIIAHNLPSYKGIYDKYIQPIDTDLYTIKRNYKIPIDNTSEQFRVNLLELYKRVMSTDNIPNSNKKYTITQHFVDGPFIEITGDSDSLFTVRFFDENNVVHHAETIASNHWIKLNRKWYTKWRVEIRENNIPVYDNTLDYTGKRVFIAFESESLGDTLAWIPYCEEFRKKHNCHVIVRTFKNFLFKKKYPQLEFVELGTTVHNLYGLYRIGWFYDTNKEPKLCNTIPLQKTASNILGLEYKEILPKIDFKPKKRLYKWKYVCIVSNSTMGCKFLPKETWQELINYLVEKGYKVINISKERNSFDNCTQIIDTSMKNTMNTIYHSEWVISLSSGLGWLAWAMNKSTILLSNFTEDWHEWSTNCIRITNKNVCHGCWNESTVIFSKSDWNFCPYHKGTSRQWECHNKISSDMIINKIKHLL